MTDAEIRVHWAWDPDMTCPADKGLAEFEGTRRVGSGLPSIWSSRRKAGASRRGGKPPRRQAVQEGGRTAAVIKPRLRSSFSPVLFFLACAGLSGTAGGRRLHAGADGDCHPASNQKKSKQDDEPKSSSKTQAVDAAADSTSLTLTQFVVVLSCEHIECFLGFLCRWFGRSGIAEAWVRF